MSDQGLVVVSLLSGLVGGVFGAFYLPDMFNDVLNAVDDWREGRRTARCTCNGVTDVLTTVYGQGGHIHAEFLGSRHAVESCPYFKPLWDGATDLDPVTWQASTSLGRGAQITSPRSGGQAERGQ